MPKRPAPQRALQADNDDVVRNESYKTGFRNLTLIVILQSIAITALVVAVLSFMYLYKPQDRFFATDPNGNQIPMVALNQPNMTQAALLAWVSQAATEIMTFGFHDYREKLGFSTRHFTVKGKESFRKALEQIKIIQNIEKNQQIITATPRGLPIITQEGPVKKNEGYFWHIQLPLIITYQSGTKSRNDLLRVDMIVVRVPTQENPMGIGIDQWLSVVGN